MMALVQSLFLTALATTVLLFVTVPAASELVDAGTACNTTAENGTVAVSSPLKKGLCWIAVNRSDTAAVVTTLYFTSVTIKGNDTLTVYDGDYNATGTNVTVITGNTGPFMVVVASALSYLVIDASEENSTSSVMATFDNDCAVQKTVTSGMSVQSPLYKPGAFAFSCDYSYSKGDDSPDTLLALSFQTLALPNATLNITSPVTVAPVHGTILPPDVYGNDTLNMTLTVPKTDLPQSFSAATVPITQSAVCGVTQTVNGSSQITLTVPEAHALSYDCRIPITALTAGKALLLTVTSLQLTDGGDRLTFLDGWSLGNPLLATLTQATSDYVVLSSGQQVLMRLVVDEMVAQRSLTVNVTELSTSHHLMNMGTFNIAAPTTVPSTDLYLLEATQEGQKVVLNLGAETGKNMSGKYSVSLYDGPQTSSPLLVTLSSAVRFPVTSTGSRMLVVVSWTGSVAQGLNASFTTSPTSGCDQVISASEGTFKLSASLTTPAPNKCHWTIAPQPNNAGTVILTLPVVQLTQKATLSVYSGVEGAGSLVAQLTADNAQSGVLLPSVALPANQFSQLVFSSGNNTNLTSADVQASFLTRDPYCGGAISSAVGHIKSPGYPNLYPLNAACEWTFPAAPASGLLFLDFPALMLAQNHTLTIKEKKNATSSQVMGTYGGSAPIPSLLFPVENASQSVVTFSAQPTKGSQLSNAVGQGFDVQYWMLDCGGNMTGLTGNFSSGNSSLCVWTLTLPESGAEKGSVNILKLNITVNGTNANQSVTVFDGNSLRAPPVALDLESGNATYSRRNAVIVLFNSSAATNAQKVSLTVSFTNFTCNATSLCDNGLCIHPGWLCNGVDDCGDNTDERNCVYPRPTPPPPSPSKGGKSGVKGFVVAVLFFVGLIVGVIGACVIPRVVGRFRKNRYTAFHNEPALA